MAAEVAIGLRTLLGNAAVAAQRVTFSAHQCFRFDGSVAEKACFSALAGHAARLTGLALTGDSRFIEALLAATPELTCRVVAYCTTDAVPVAALEDAGASRHADVAALPEIVKTVLLCETQYVERQRMRQKIADSITIVDPDILVAIAPNAIPRRAWTPVERHIYPVEVPAIDFEPGLDVLLLDCPARNLALLPNGLAYVHNCLKHAKVKFQTFDLDIVTYHRYHMRRLFDESGEIVLPSGYKMPLDPWQAEHYDLWAKAEVIEYLMPIIEEAAAAVIKAAPKVLALSLQQCNEAYTRALVNRVKAALPEIVILVGGFSCYNPDIGLRAFPECDYMCIGEADLTIGLLVKALARGERPRNQPGVLSKYDTPDYRYLPAPMPHDLDKIPEPRYDWASISLYRNYNGYQLVPIIASRGCRWSRCTFCAERFYWRIRTAKNFVNELEWLVEQGCTLFMFNESDLNGNPDKLLDICDEIIARGLKVKLTGQLRIHKKCDRAFFQKLRAAGFVALRFGVDAFSDNTMRLQRKGYTSDMVSQNLQDCWEAGIYTEVNWVIGVPGETDQDVEEGIALILKNQKFIGRLANINPLILVNGSVYWIDPESHKIRFRRPQDEIKAEFPRAIPADLWYSEGPYIDAQVRKDRFERIVLSLHDAGFPVGAWAQRVIEDVRLRRDKHRAGSTPSDVAAPEAAAAEAAPALPRKLEETSTHRVHQVADGYLAIPLERTDLDAADAATRVASGVVFSESLDSLRTELEDSARWANTRGQYDAQERQRKAGSYMRADSALGESQIEELKQPIILSHNGAHFAIEQDELRRKLDVALNPLLLPEYARNPIRNMVRRARRLRRMGMQITRSLLGRDPLADCLPFHFIAGAPQWVVGKHARIASIQTTTAVPDLLTTIGNYNVVEFDGMVYALPHGFHPEWGSVSLARQPGVFADTSPRAVIAWVRTKVEAPQPVAQIVDIVAKSAVEYPEPQLLAELEGYDIVGYEGWIYGIPQSLGNIDLTAEDVVGMQGVIRDVSRDVVENEILDIAARQAAAE